MQTDRIRTLLDAEKAPNRIGRSINQNVKNASSNEPTMIPAIAKLGMGAGSIVRAKKRRGQCQR